MSELGSDWPKPNSKDEALRLVTQSAESIRDFAERMSQASLRALETVTQTSFEATQDESIEGSWWPLASAFPLVNKLKYQSVRSLEKVIYGLPETRRDPDDPSRHLEYHLLSTQIRNDQIRSAYLPDVANPVKQLITDLNAWVEQMSEDGFELVADVGIHVLDFVYISVFEDTPVVRKKITRESDELVTILNFPRMTLAVPNNILTSLDIDALSP